MQIKALAHVALRVTARERAKRFYGGVLGLPICARLDEGGLKMAFSTLGNRWLPDRLAARMAACRLNVVTRTE